MNKTHIASTGVGAGFTALGVNLFLPAHLHLSPDQMAVLVGILPTIAMAVVTGIEAAFPQTKRVFDAVETAVSTTTTQTIATSPVAGAPAHA